MTLPEAQRNKVQRPLILPFWEQYPYRKRIHFCELKDCRVQWRNVAWPNAVAAAPSGTGSQGNMMRHCCSGVSNWLFFNNQLVMSPAMQEDKVIAIKSINNWYLWRHVPTTYISDQNDRCPNLRQTWHRSKWVRKVPSIFLSLRRWPADQHRYTIRSWTGTWTLW